MCGVIAGLTAAMTGLQMMQQRQQYKAQQDAYNAQAQAADANAKIVEQNQRINERKAENIADQYAWKQGQLDDKRRLVRGQVAAAQGAAGLTGVGSGLDLLAASNEAYYQDSMNLLQDQRNDMYDNRIANWNLENQKIGYQNQAKSYRAAAANAVQQGKLGMLSTLAGGALSIYGMKGQSSKAKADTGTSTGSISIGGPTDTGNYLWRPYGQYGGLDEVISYSGSAAGNHLMQGYTKRGWRKLL